MPDTALAKRYRAFISYSHAADGRLAPALHKALHRFARPLLATRAINVFRDQTNLSTSPGLWSSVERELADSEFLILLASPVAAASKWVRKEVDYWLTHASSETLLIVLTDGAIVYDEERRDFDWQRTTALPPNLAGVYTEEPHYLDLSWAKDAPGLTLRDARFREHVADLAATLHRKPKHEMLGDDLQRQKGLRRSIAAVAAVVLVLVIVATVLAMTSARQRSLALSGQLAAAARGQVTTDPERAVLLALEAVNRSPTAEAVASLRETLVRAGQRIEFERVKNSIRAGQSGPVATEFVSEASSRDGSVTVKAGDQFALRAEVTGAADAITFRGHRTDVNGVDVSPDNMLVASVDQDGKGYVWETRTGTVVFTMRPEMEGFGYARALWSPDGRLLLTGGQDAQTQVWERETWRRLAVFGDMRGAVDLLAMSADGRSVVTGSTTAPYGAPVERAATAWDTRTGKSLGYRADPGLVVEGVGFSPDSRLAFTEYEGAISELWNPGTGDVVATWNDDGLTIASELEQSTATLDAAGSDGSGEGVLGVVRLGFSSDGGVLATVDSGDNVLLWRVPSWSRLDAPDAQRTSVAARAAPESSAREVKSPDGKWVAVANGSRYVRVHRWETIAPLDMLQAYAARLVTRSLTPAERAEFLPGLWQQTR